MTAHFDSRKFSSVDFPSKSGWEKTSLACMPWMMCRSSSTRRKRCDCWARAVGPRPPLAPWWLPSCRLLRGPNRPIWRGQDFLKKLEPEALRPCPRKSGRLFFQTPIQFAPPAPAGGGDCARNRLDKHRHLPWSAVPRPRWRICFRTGRPCAPSRLNCFRTQFPRAGNASVIARPVHLPPTPGAIIL